MLNAVRGAQDARQTIFFSPEPPLWSDRALEPVHDGLAEASVQGDSPRSAAPNSPAEVHTSEAAHTQNRSIGREEQTSPATRSIRFNWIREVSQAGNSAVFRAEEAQTGNLVTVELLSQRAACDAEQVRLFYLEAEAAARLQHPQIAQAYAAEPFAVTHMRRATHLPASKTLRELLAQSGWFEPVRALRIITQMADALASAHEAGVLHLNLQPEHVWLDGTDQLLITGFGIAADGQLEWARRIGTGRCAPPYLSPEQLSGHPGDHASDLYALGVIFYEMLTDRVPFDSNDLDQLRRRHKIKRPRPPYDFNQNLPLELSETALALLERDPQARARAFSGAGRFKSLLNRAGVTEPAPPCP